MLWALVAAALAGVVFVGLSYEHIGGLPGFVVPVWAIPGGDGLVIPTPPRWRCPGIPTPRAPRPRCSVRPSSAWAPRWRRWWGVLGNNEIALAFVMTAGMVIALLLLTPSLGWGDPQAVGVPATETKDDVTGDAVAEPA